MTVHGEHDDQPTMGMPEPPRGGGGHPGEMFGDFQLVRELGRGGMGVVYKAWEPGLNRHVALKVILSGTLSNPDDMTRFRTEASAAAGLQHSNIFKVYRVGVHEGRHYYTMDCIEGMSLAQRLVEGPLSGRVAARYLVTVARAIHHAHEHGILHRDIKPGNILLDTSDQPHVADFGLAKHLDSDQGQTQTGAVLGTPGSMAPEQASGSKNLGPTTDVYGLGALLYELLTARPPFRGETALDTLQQVMQNDAAPPRLLNPRIDRDLETICLKCLSKRPIDRYPSALALAEDLERYLAGDSIQARSLNMIDYLGRTLERSQFDAEFDAYGAVVLWFAVIVGVTHVLKQVFISQRLPMESYLALQTAQFLLMIVVLWRARPHGLVPTTMAERLLWSVWIGYVIACILVSVATRWMFGREILYQGVLYPYYCMITGMAFFVLGSSFWGKLYAVGAVFFGVGLLLALYLDRIPWSTLVFGGLWTLTLTLIGLRLRSLGRHRKQTDSLPGSSSMQTQREEERPWRGMPS